MTGIKYKQFYYTAIDNNHIVICNGTVDVKNTFTLKERLIFQNLALNSGQKQIISVTFLYLHLQK